MSFQISYFFQLMTEIQDSIKTNRIIIHGNNGFKSSQLLEQINITPERYSLETENGRFEFFPFTDLNSFNKYLPIQPCTEMARLIEQSEQGVDISAILVLISQTEIFSQGMHNLISKIPHKDDKFGYRFGNEKEWWSHVIIVFSFGENEGGDERVRKSIVGNSGIREIVAKAGDRYMSVSNNTTTEEFIGNLHKILTQQLKQKKIILGIDLSQKIQDNYADKIPTEPSLREKLILLLTCFGFILLLIGVYYYSLISTVILLVVWLFIVCTLPWILGTATITTILRKHSVMMRGWLNTP